MPKLFKNLKVQEKYEMFLVETRNVQEVDSRSGKYKVFKGIDSNGEYFFFLGKSGAVRFSRKNASTTSIDYKKYLTKSFVTWCLGFKENKIVSLS